MAIVLKISAYLAIVGFLMNNLAHTSGGVIITIGSKINNDGNCK